MKDRANDDVDLMTQRPLRTKKWRRGERVTILVPRARSVIGRHFCDAFGLKGSYNVNLDEYGSRVWALCDGDRTVKQIADELKEAFGKRVEPLYDRLVVFIGMLKNEDLIKFV